MADEPLFDSGTDGRDPTSMTGHARTTTEHEVASTTSPGQPTGPTEQADLQGEPTASHRPPQVNEPLSDSPKMMDRGRTDVDYT